MLLPRAVNDDLKKVRGYSSLAARKQRPSTTSGSAAPTRAASADATVLRVKPGDQAGGVGPEVPHQEAETSPEPSTGSRPTTSASSSPSWAPSKTTPATAANDPIIPVPDNASPASAAGLGASSSLDTDRLSGAGLSPGLAEDEDGNVNESRRDARELVAQEAQHLPGLSTSPTKRAAEALIGINPPALAQALPEQQTNNVTAADATATVGNGLELSLSTSSRDDTGEDNNSLYGEDEGAPPRKRVKVDPALQEFNFNKINAHLQLITSAVLVGEISVQAELAKLHQHLSKQAQETTFVMGDGGATLKSAFIAVESGGHVGSQVWLHRALLRMQIALRIRQKQQERMLLMQSGQKSVGSRAIREILLEIKADLTDSHPLISARKLHEHYTAGSALLTIAKAGSVYMLLVLAAVHTHFQNVAWDAKIGGLFARSLEPIEGGRDHSPFHASTIRHVIRPAITLLRKAGPLWLPLGPDGEQRQFGADVYGDSNFLGEPHKDQDRAVHDFNKDLVFSALGFATKPNLVEADKLITGSVHWLRTAPNMVLPPGHLAGIGEQAEDLVQPPSAQQQEPASRMGEQWRLQLAQDLFSQDNGVPRLTSADGDQAKLWAEARYKAVEGRSVHSLPTATSVVLDVPDWVKDPASKLLKPGKVKAKGYVHKSKVLAALHASDDRQGSAKYYQFIQELAKTAHDVPAGQPPAKLGTCWQRIGRDHYKNSHVVIPSMDARNPRPFLHIFPSDTLEPDKYNRAAAYSAEEVVSTQLGPNANAPDANTSPGTNGHNRQGDSGPAANAPSQTNNNQRCTAGLPVQYGPICLQSSVRRAKTNKTPVGLPEPSKGSVAAGPVGQWLAARMSPLVDFYWTVLRSKYPAINRKLEGQADWADGIVDSPCYPYNSLVHEAGVRPCFQVGRDTAGTLSGLTPFGQWTGGELVFPELKLVIDIAPGTALLFASMDLIHGFFPVGPVDGSPPVRHCTILSNNGGLDSWVDGTVRDFHAEGHKRSRRANKQALAQNRPKRLGRQGQAGDQAVDEAEEDQDPGEDSLNEEDSEDDS